MDGSKSSHQNQVQHHPVRLAKCCKWRWKKRTCETRHGLIRSCNGDRDGTSLSGSLLPACYIRHTIIEPRDCCGGIVTHGDSLFTESPEVGNDLTAHGERSLRITRNRRRNVCSYEIPFPLVQRFHCRHYRDYLRINQTPHRPIGSSWVTYSTMKASRHAPFFSPSSSLSPMYASVSVFDQASVNGSYRQTFATNGREV